jgi:hypothetical protein
VDGATQAGAFSTVYWVPSNRLTVQFPEEGSKPLSPTSVDST